MIRIPSKVDAKLKKAVLKAYTAVVKEVGEAEYKYIVAKLSIVCKRLERYPNSWPSPLAKVARVLYVELRTAQSSPRNLPPASRLLILSALFYLCDPYDVIPDFTPGTGYFDDAIVLNECLRQIKRIRAKDYRRILSELESERS